MSDRKKTTLENLFLGSTEQKLQGEQIHENLGLNALENKRSIPEELLAAYFTSEDL